MAGRHVRPASLSFGTPDSPLAVGPGLTHICGDAHSHRSRGIRGVTGDTDVHPGSFSAYIFGDFVTAAEGYEAAVG